MDFLSDCRGHIARDKTFHILSQHPENFRLFQTKSKNFCSSQWDAFRALGGRRVKVCRRARGARTCTCGFYTSRLSLSLSVCVLGALVNGVDQCYGRRTAGRIEKTRAGDCARPIARDCAFQRDYISLEDFIGETRSVCVVLRVPWRPIRCASGNRR